MRYLLHTFFWLLSLGALLALTGYRVYAQAPAPAWQAIINVPGTSVTATATMANGEVVLAGSFTGTAAFGSTVLTSVGTSQTDVFVAKWSPTTQTFVWAVRAGGSSGDEATALAVQGNSIYVAGQVSSPTADFGSLTFTNSLSSGGLADVFVTKLTDVGTSASFTWLQQASGNATEQATSLAVLGNNIYFTGWFGGSSIRIGSTTLPSAGDYDGFVAKLTDAGTTSSFNWALRLSTTTRDQANALAVSGTSVYVAGHCGRGLASFGTLTLPATTNASFLNAYVAKLTDAGSSASFTWAQRAGGSDNVTITGLGLNGTSIYVGGTFNGSTATLGSFTLANVNYGSYFYAEGFVAKLTDAGSSASFTWAQPISGASRDEVLSLAVAGSSVYLGGVSQSTTLRFGDVVLDTPGNGINAFLAKLTDAGPSASFTWAKGTSNSFTAMTQAVSVAGATVYAAGYFTGPTVFGSQTFPVNSGAGFLAPVLDVPAPILTSVSPGSSQPGGAITLSGANLSGATAVSFIGTNTNISTATTGLVVNAAGTQLTVLIPAGASSGDLVVTTPTGVSNRLGFTVGTNPRTWQSATSLGGLFYQTVTATCADASGNIYVAGYFTGSITIGSTQLTNAGGSDAFVAKWSPTTNSFLWAVRAGGSGNEQTAGLAWQGNHVYLTGSFTGATTSVGGSTLANAGPAATNDIFIARLTDTGTGATFDWAQQAGGPGDDWGSGVAISGSTLYISGRFSVTATMGTTTLTSAGDTDAFVAKLVDGSTSSSFSWAYQAGGTGDDVATSVAATGTAVYLAGSVRNAASFGSMTFPAVGNLDAFVAKLTDAGSTASFTWVLPGGGLLNDQANALVATGTNLYVGGYFDTGASFGSTQLTGVNSNGFLAKIVDAGATGSYVWALGMGGSGVDLINALAVQGSRIYVAGGFTNATMSFGQNTLVNADPYSTFPGFDAFVGQCLDAGTTASFTWALAGGGLYNEQATAVAVAGTRVVVGGFAGVGAMFGSYALANSSVAGFLATVTDGSLLAAKPTLPAAADITLYPNPASSTATLVLPASLTAATTHITLCNQLGQVVHRQTERVLPSGAAFTLDVAALSAGIYWVQIQTGSVRIYKRLVVENQ